MFNLISHFEKNQNFAESNLFLSLILTRIDFAGIYVSLVGLYALSRPYHFDGCGLHAARTILLMVFLVNSARGCTGHMIKSCTLNSKLFEFLICLSNCRMLLRLWGKPISFELLMNKPQLGMVSTMEHGSSGLGSSRIMVTQAS